MGGGDNLQFYSKFALFSTLGGMNLDHDFFQVSKSSEDQKKWNTFCPRIQVKTKKQKKRSSPKMEHFFSPNSSGDLRSDAHRIQIFGGDANANYWGGYSQIIGGIYLPRF